MKTKEMNAAMKNSEVALMTERVRLAKNPSGTSGCFARRSTTTIARSRQTPAASGTTTPADPQAWSAARSSPYTIAMRPPVEVIAPVTSRRWSAARTIRLSATSRGTSRSTSRATGRLM